MLSAQRKLSTDISLLDKEVLWTLEMLRMVQQNATSIKNNQGAIALPKLLPIMLGRSMWTFRHFI